MKIQEHIQRIHTALEEKEFLTAAEVHNILNMPSSTAAREIKRMKNLGAFYVHRAQISRYFKSYSHFTEWESKQPDTSWRREMAPGAFTSKKSGFIAGQSPVNYLDQLLRGVRG